MRGPLAEGLSPRADHGFDPLIFADARGALTLITDAAFAEWRRQLIEKRASG